MNNKIDWQQELPLEAQQKREVFARFGLAIYQAQCVERQIGILLATKHNSDFFNSSPTERDAIFDSKFSQTLGQLLKELAKRTSLPIDFESRLRHGLKLRNWIAHNYFWERPGSLLTWNGREQMIQELQEVANHLSELDNELTSISEQWATVNGVSRESVEAEMAKFRQGHNA